MIAQLEISRTYEDGTTVTYRKGDVWRVIQPGAYLSVKIWLRGGWTSTRLNLEPGTELVCHGQMYSGGGDGVMLVGWVVTEAMQRQAEADYAKRAAPFAGESYHASSVAEFYPGDGAFWNNAPQPGYVERVEG
jgi:hypothetical protein